MGLLAGLALAACSGPASETHVAAGSTPAVTAAREPDAVGTVKHLRVLSQEQYLNTLAYVFGPDVKVEPRFPPARRTDGLLALGAASAGVTATQLELYQKAAATVAGLVTKPERRNFLLTCTPADEKAADKACATQFLADKGRLLMRRPVPKAELDAFVDQADHAADVLKDFYAGLGVALEALLVSPKVLFVNETSEPDPQHHGRERLDAYSLASRLSLFLWDAAPDDAVLKAAETGEIQTPKGRARVVAMMLASPRLEAGVRAFFDDMFGFDDFSTLSKDTKVYPSFTGVTAIDAREQTLRTIVDHLITKDRDYRDLFTTRETFVSPALAAVYGIPAPPNWTPYTFPEDSGRAGILTQISFLAVHSHPARTSPTLRGKALRELLLCQRVPPPPPNVDFSAVDNPNSPIKTVRERINFHQKNPACAGCHKIMDPMGLALENFDGIGRYRDNEKGAVIDASGTLDGVSFKDVAGLGKAVHDHPALTSCLVRRVYAYGTDSAVKPDDKDELDYLNGRFAAAGYRLPDLLRTIAMSTAFSEVAPPQDTTVKSAGAQVTAVASSK